MAPSFILTCSRPLALAHCCFELPIVAYNNPFGIFPLNNNSIWAYQIPRNNYLDQTPGFEPRNIWWRLTGAATNVYQSAAGQRYYGDPTFGQTFEAITFPISAGTSPNPTAPTNQQYFQLANTTRNNFSAVAADQFIFGRINPAYTNGVIIGYVRVSNESWQDSGNYMFNVNLAPKPPAFPIDTTVNNPRANIEALCRVWAAGMQYVVTTLGAQAVIIDTRTNLGGQPADGIAIVSCFGGNRKAMGFIESSVDTGFSAPFNISTFNIYQDAVNQAYQPMFNILTTNNDSFYPGSVFKNGKCRLIDDRTSGSEGDAFPHFFLGDNQDKNIGNGVTVKIFGDICGILAGLSSGSVIHHISDPSLIVTFDGQPIYVYQYAIESQSAGMLKATAEPTPSLCQRPVISA